MVPSKFLHLLKSPVPPHRTPSPSFYLSGSFLSCIHGYLANNSAKVRKPQGMGPVHQNTVFPGLFAWQITVLSLNKTMNIAVI